MVTENFRNLRDAGLFEVKIGDLRTSLRLDITDIELLIQLHCGLNPTTMIVVGRF